MPGSRGVYRRRVTEEQTKQALELYAPMPASKPKPLMYVSVPLPYDWTFHNAPIMDAIRADYADYIIRTPRRNATDWHSRFRAIVSEVRLALFIAPDGYLSHIQFQELQTLAGQAVPCLVYFTPAGQAFGLDKVLFTSFNWQCQEHYVSLTAPSQGEQSQPDQSQAEDAPNIATRYPPL